MQEVYGILDDLKAKRQLIDCAPLQPATVGANVKVRDGKRHRDRWSVRRNARSARRILDDRRRQSRRGDPHRGPAPGAASAPSKFDRCWRSPTCRKVV